ncbi:hemolymph lipopolysaccharide-binding protein isoform X3 [Cryptotermes secundus]|uniref:hemolymph lipopolysaccharide-binding protein isoform X3 n=1 Tax=Cryptotermes secundus TaxID=105785 RepID=UPI000CD7B662|nr:hemolymph lipopolysaccharide-binding protein isoform X3 [Cryptotermes secundus]
MLMMDWQIYLRLKLAVMCACVSLSWAQNCPSQKHAAAKFTINSHRNQTGHWISQVWLQHSPDSHTVTSPWMVEVEQNTASCKGVESVQLVATLTAPPIRAGPGYELRRGVGYYKIHTEPKTWQEARQICEQEGAHLAVINSEEESKVLQSLFAPVAAKLKVAWAFVGFHDLYNEGQYLTIFDEPLNSSGFYRWVVGQPDNWGGNDRSPGEDCGSIHTNGGLNDLTCTAKVPFICEQELWLEPHADLMSSLKCHSSTNTDIALEVPPA